MTTSKFIFCGVQPGYHNVSEIFASAEYLRTALRQVTLNVPIRDYGLPSLGFSASVVGNMHEIGCAWQKIAKQYQISSGIHISTGIVDLDNDNLILSADANPKNITNLSLWQNIAFDIFHDLGLPAPVFHSVGYNFVPALL